MSGFKLTENGRLNMSLFKDKLKLGDLNSNSKLEKLFALFDISKDGELDSNEIKQLLGKFNTYASSNDKSIFETEEVQTYLNETVDTNGEKLAKNISVSDVLAFLKTLAVEKQATQPSIPQSDEALSEQELQQVAVQTLNDDSTKARALFDKQNKEQGPVSNASNWVKELFNTEYAQTQVDRALMVDEFSAFLIKKASSPEGITKKEYYEAKIEFIVQLVKKFDKSIDEANLEQSRRGLKNLSPQRIDSIVQSISTLTDNCTPQEIVDCIKTTIELEFNAQNSQPDSIDLQVREVAQKLPNKPSETTLADMEASGTLNEKMEFEEVFFAERGVIYNKEAINNYALKNAQFEILSQMHNTVALIDTVSNEVMSDQRNEVSLGKNQIDTLNNLVSSIYGTNLERAKEDLAIDGVSLALHDGKIVVSQNGLPLQRIKALSLLIKLKEVHQGRFEKALGDKTFEEYAQENSEAYKKAYGYSNVSTIVNNYIESQGQALGWMKAGATYTGMALMIAGDLIPIPAGKALKVLGTVGKMAMSTGGLLTATFGSAGISYLESSGKAGGMTEEDKQEILEEVKNGVLLTASGMWISKVSHSVAQTVAQTCPKLLALASEIGVDGAMSLVADLAITGEINFSGEGVAQLTNVLVGIIRARGVKNFMKDYAPKGVNGVNDGAGKTELPASKNNDGVNDGAGKADNLDKSQVDNINFDNREPFITELKKNKTLLTQDIDVLLKLLKNKYNNEPEIAEQILNLSNRGYGIEAIESYVNLISKYPDLKDIVISVAPKYQFLDNIFDKPTAEALEKRYKNREKIKMIDAFGLETLERTLGQKFVSSIRWEEIIPDNATPEQIKQTLVELNNRSKFFNKQNSNNDALDKNIKWAHEVNMIEEIAEYLVSKSKNPSNFQTIINLISNGYRHLDAADNKHRFDHGGYQHRGELRQDGSVATPFNNSSNSYGGNGYFEDFTKSQNRVPKHRGVSLTMPKIINETSGKLQHPDASTCELAFKIVGKNYNKLLPLVKKVQSGEKLTEKELKFVDENIAEIHFILANSMPWARGTAGIAEIFTRTMYKSLGINKPAVREGYSLDLEAFAVMDFEEYKTKWNTFFEGTTEPNHRIEEDLPIPEIEDLPVFVPEPELEPLTFKDSTEPYKSSSTNAGWGLDGSSARITSDDVINKFKSITNADNNSIINFDIIKKELASFNDNQLEQFEKIMELVQERHKDGYYDIEESYYDIASELMSIINNLGKDNFDLALDILTFRSDTEVLDAEFTNLFRFSKEDIPRIKALMEASNENPFLQNIHNILYVLSETPASLSVDELKHIFMLKDKDGNFVLNEDTFDKHSSEGFQFLDNTVSTKDIDSVKSNIKNRFQNIQENDLNNLLATVKDKKSKMFLDKILTLKSAKGTSLFNLDMVEQTMKFVNEHPEKLDMLNDLIKKTTDDFNHDVEIRLAGPLAQIRYNQAYKRSMVGNWETILDFASGSENDKVLKYLMNNTNNVPFVSVVKTLQENNHPQKIEVANKLIDMYEFNGADNILFQLNIENFEIIKKALVAGKEKYSVDDINSVIRIYQDSIHQYKDEVEILSNITVSINKALDEKISVDFIKLLPDSAKLDIENNTNISDFIIDVSKLSNRGSNRFSVIGLREILNSLPQPIQDKHLNYVKNLVQKYPDITTTEILKNIKGLSIEIPNKVEYPFGENGKFKPEYDRITNSKVWNDLPNDTRAKLFDYMSKLVEQDPNRFKRLVDSGYFELCSQGKCDINDLINNIGTNKFFSKNYLNDVKRLYSGEPLVKEFANGTPLETIAKQVPEGEVAYVNGKLYVNDSGSMVQLNMTKEKFEELFPLEGRFNTKQHGIGDCWLISAMDNLMDLPNGRAKLYQLFSQEGDDIIVIIPHKRFEEAEYNEPQEDGSFITVFYDKPVDSPYVLKFKDGKPLINPNKQVQACPGIQLIEQAYGVKRSGSIPETQGPIEIANLVDIDAQIDALNGGHSYEFISDVLGYEINGGLFKNAFGEVKGSIFTKTGDSRFQHMREADFNQRAIAVFESMANDENILLHFSTKHIDSNASRVEKTLNIPNHLYSNHAYTVKGYDKERGFVYFTNPWDSNSVVEMDVYSFLSYIDTISLLEIN